MWLISLWQVGQQARCGINHRGQPGRPEPVPTPGEHLYKKCATMGHNACGYPSVRNRPRRMARQTIAPASRYEKRQAG